MMLFMDQVLADRLADVAALCRRHRVARLDVFGSAARQAHGAADLDLLVEFQELPADAYADAYFGLLADLETLLGRPVDLVMASAVSNPFVRETIERSRVPLHAA
jgi:predicted nucleotidyltransferase